MTKYPGIVAHLASLCDDEESPQRLRDLLAVVLYNSHVRPDRIDAADLVALLTVAEDCWKGTGPVGAVEMPLEGLLMFGVGQVPTG